MARTSTCAYCGQTRDCNREHVLPRSVIGPKFRGDARFVLVPTCYQCNASFSHDEDHFRNFIISAGSFSEATAEVFYGPMGRALRRTGHGTESLRDLLGMIREYRHDGRTEHRVHPDARVFRVLRKIVRGLLFKHFDKPFPVHLVEVRELEYKLGPEIMALGDWKVIHPQIFQYAFVAGEMEVCHSLWVLQFFQTASFFGSVSDSHR
jgi:hypothetical protein